MEIVLDSMLRVPKDRLGEQGIRDLRRMHTLRPRRRRASYGNPQPLLAYNTGLHYVAIPRRSDMARSILDRNSVSDRRSSGTPVELEWKASFREGQQSFVEDVTEGIIRTDMGGLGRAGCGFGKTVAGTAVIGQLGVTTLIGVHKKALLRQWRKEIKNFLGVEPGIVHGDTCDFEGRQVVIAMIQSLNQRDYPPELYLWPGLTVWDECHHISAPTFSAVVQRFPSRWRLGLTATPRRGDGFEDVFYWHIGGLLAEGRGKFLDCRVNMLDYQLSLDESLYCLRGQPHMSKLVTELSKVEARTDLHCRIMRRCAQRGRKVLALSDRVAHVEQVVDKMNIAFQFAQEPYRAGHYSAGSSKRAGKLQDEAADCDITVGTWPMASEGLDIPRKDTLVMLTPKADVEQASGRIRRLFKGKASPLIIDTRDSIGLCYGLAAKRLDFFRSSGLDKQPWPVKFISA
jgi:superfamily II DNA or RNA helicase